MKKMRKFIACASFKIHKIGICLAQIWLYNGNLPVDEHYSPVSALYSSLPTSAHAVLPLSAMIPVEYS